MPCSSLTLRIILTQISGTFLNSGCSMQISRSVLITRLRTLIPVSCERRKSILGQMISHYHCTMVIIIIYIRHPNGNNINLCYLAWFSELTRCSTLKFCMAYTLIRAFCAIDCILLIPVSFSAICDMRLYSKGAWSQKQAPPRTILSNQPFRIKRIIILNLA